MRLREFVGAPQELAAHDYHEAFRTLVARLSALAGGDPTSWRVLELGCGFTYPNALLLPGLGADYVGVDVLSVFARDGSRALYRSYRREGLPIWRAAPRAWRRGLRTRLYHRRLAQLAGRPLPHREARLHSYDGRHLPFAAASFDVIASNAVLEHVADLEAFAGEVARVLRPGGVADMLWHNYYCYSGGHRPPEVHHAHPWGHLTGQGPADAAAMLRNLPYLNRATPEEVAAAFGRHLEVLRVVGADAAHRLQGEDPAFAFEAESLLTPELAARLSSYPRELLLTRSYLLQARRI